MNEEKQLIHNSEIIAPVKNDTLSSVAIFSWLPLSSFVINFHIYFLTAVHVINVKPGLENIKVTSHLYFQAIYLKCPSFKVIVQHTKSKIKPLRWNKYLVSDITSSTSQSDSHIPDLIFISFCVKLVGFNYLKQVFSATCVTSVS